MVGIPLELTVYYKILYYVDECEGSSKNNYIAHA